MKKRRGSPKKHKPSGNLPRMRPQLAQPTSRALTTAFQFCQKHWQWLINAALAVVALLVGR